MVKGQCLCGQIQYSYHAEIESSILCFCQHCKLAQGSIGAWNSPIQLEYFDIVQGSQYLKSYFHTVLKARVFCSECGSAIYSHRLDLPNIIRLRMGTVTEGAIPVPNESFYNQHKPDFIDCLLR